MNIHEYQAKALLSGFGLPVPRGAAAFTVALRRPASNRRTSGQANESGRAAMAKT